MSDIISWGIVGTLMVAAIGVAYNATLKTAEAAHSLKLANEEITRLRKQIEMIQNETKNLPDQAGEPNAVNKFEAIKLPCNGVDALHNILALIAKYHSQEMPATPKRIAEDLQIDQGIMLAQMRKYTAEQFITFCNGGKQPDLDTAFFLSPKAWECVAIVQA